MRIATIASVAVALTLSACAGPPTPPPFSPIVSGLVNLIPANVRAQIIAKCGWAPYVDDIAALLASLPYVTTIDTVVDMVCSAVQTAAMTAAGPMARKGAALVSPRIVYVRGVPIRRQR